MATISIVLLVTALIALLLSFHFGPHALVATSGVVVVVSSVAIALAGLGILFATDPVVAVVTLSAALLGSGASLIWGYRSIRSSRSEASCLDTDRLRSSTAVAATDLAPTGIVLIDGEQWSAESIDGPIRAGTRVLVAELRGLRVIVVSDPLSFDQTNVSHHSKES